MPRSDGELLRTWERRTGAGLTALAVVFVVAYAAPILWPELPPRWDRAAHTANLVIWVMFGADYAFRLAIAPQRRAFVRGHLFDLAVLVLPVLRPLRLLRLVTALMVIERRTEVWTRGKLAVYVAATTALLVVVGALAILDAERGEPASNISSYPDALWWAVVTVTTVGYGDHFPVSITGRAVALGLMVSGIGLLGFVTGSLATWVMERISAVEQSSEATKADVSDVVAEVKALRAEVAALRASTGGPAAAPTTTAATSTAATSTAPSTTAPSTTAPSTTAPTTKPRRPADP